MNMEEFERMFAAKKSDAELTREECDALKAQNRLQDKKNNAEEMLGNLREGSGMLNIDTANSRQIGGEHYKNMRIQPWDVVDATFSHAEAKGFYRGSALAYIMRAGTKGPAREDYEKAIHYIQKLLEVL